MNDRQFLSGLSGGASFFAVAGAFWLGLGISSLAGKAEWWVFALLTLLQASGCVGLIWIATRLRRNARSRFPGPRRTEGREKREARHILIRFCWTTLGQAILIGIAVWYWVHAQREPMIWPSISLVVSLHLVPMAKIFHVRAYYGTACVGAAVSLTAFPWATAPYALTCLGGAMAGVMWISAAYILVRSQAIAERAMRETWAV
jgi:hypothetical protein